MSVVGNNLSRVCLVFMSYYYYIYARRVLTNTKKKPIVRNIFVLTYYAYYNIITFILQTLEYGQLMARVSINANSWVVSVEVARLVHNNNIMQR